MAIITRERASQRDDLYMTLINAGIAPERAAEMVEEKLPYTPSVRSEPLANGKPIARKGKTRGGLSALAIVLFVFGALGWLAGGKYTVEGWVVALNMFGRWIGLAAQLDVPRGVPLIVAVLLSGVVYSRVELLALRNTVQRMPSFWIAWLLIFLTDVGSTFFGIISPAPDAAPILRQLAIMPYFAFLWALVLTLLPEYLILSSIRLLKR